MLSVKLRRYDPEGSGYSLVDFDIEAGTGDSVLGLLAYIKGSIDESFAYTAFCTNEHCGECGVMLNGVPVLACRETVKSEDLLIEPLKGFPPVRDLVVDLAPVIEKIWTALPDISAFTDHQEAPGCNETFATDDGLKLFMAGRCICCGLCMSVCHIHKLDEEEVSGPMFFMALAQYMMRAKSGGKLAELSEIAGRHSLSKCTLCGRCAKVCPQKIEISSVISIMNQMFQDNGLFFDEEKE